MQNKEKGRMNKKVISYIVREEMFRCKTYVRFIHLISVHVTIINNFNFNDIRSFSKLKQISPFFLFSEGRYSEELNHLGSTSQEEELFCILVLN